MRAARFIKILFLIAAIVAPLALASVGHAESGAHRGGSQPSGDVRTR